MSTTTITYADDIMIGDFIAVRHGLNGRTEGIVIDSTYDYAGRQVIAVRLDSTGEVFTPTQGHVTRVKRVGLLRSPTLSLSNNGGHIRRTVQRHVYW